MLLTKIVDVMSSKTSEKRNKGDILLIFIRLCVVKKAIFARIFHLTPISHFVFKYLKM